jgi:hypothetical protein
MHEISQEHLHTEDLRNISQVWRTPPCMKDLRNIFTYRTSGTSSQVWRTSVCLKDVRNIFSPMRDHPNKEILMNISMSVVQYSSTEDLRNIVTVKGD